MATDALVLKHQAISILTPQYWLNIQFIGQASYENIRLLLDSIQKKNYILEKITQSFKC